jgi:hypothetical protein
LTSALADANLALVELGEKILRKHIDLQWVRWVETQVGKNETGGWSLPVTPSWKVMMLRDFEKKLNVKTAAAKLQCADPAAFSTIINFYDANAELSAELAALASFDWKATNGDPKDIRAKSTNLCSKYNVWKEAIRHFSKKVPRECSAGKVFPFKERVGLDVDKIFCSAWRLLMSRPIELLQAQASSMSKAGLMLRIPEDVQTELKAAANETCSDASFLLTGLIVNESAGSADTQVVLTKVTNYVRSQCLVWIEMESNKAADDFGQLGKLLKTFWDMFAVVLEFDPSKKIVMDIEFPEETWRHWVERFAPKHVRCKL